MEYLLLTIYSRERLSILGPTKADRAKLKIIQYWPVFGRFPNYIQILATENNTTPQYWPNAKMLPGNPDDCGPLVLGENRFCLLQTAVSSIDSTESGAEEQCEHTKEIVESTLLVLQSESVKKYSLTSLLAQQSKRLLNIFCGLISLQL